ncbi:AAA family ATPase [Specibacter cremeus]|uniref:AAA family ATPase n=1 Tax=Specibacter cremeus TaxID=1629051 RepID=UPI0013DDB96F|nr:SMC family ATPase [Specibacter cremeus]
MEIQAFGPFAGREVVDFDALGAQGLFLLNGSTGAGKTSVLDAIAYALYGSVPGARQGAVKRLRSHHAADGVGPEVVCEFSAGGRRLEVRRSPEWMRPAKRGTGTTKEQASTQLREKSGDAWVVLSQRNDEAAVEIEGLLGMDMEQFTKVVLLAQGEFAAFLRATAQDREDLLEKLFGTEIYQDLENRLTADAKAAAADVAAGMAELAACEQLARSQADGILAGFAAEALAGDADAHPGAESGGAAEGAELFVRLTAALARAVQQAATRAAETEEQARLATAEVQAAGQRSTRHALRDAALAEHTRLADLADDADQWRGSLRRHHEAEILAAVVKSAAATAAEHRNAVAAVTLAGAAFSADALAAEVTGLAAALPNLPGVAALAAADRALTGQGAAVDAAIPDEQRLAQVTAELAAGEQALAAATGEVTVQQAAEAGGTARLLRIKDELTAVRDRAGSVQHAQQQHGTAVELMKSIKAHAAQKLRVGTLAEADLAAREEAVGAMKAWVDAIDFRLSLAAGELAAKLEDGKPCPVCGSVEHPAPSALAGSGADAVQAEKAAKQASGAADKRAAAARAALTEANQALAVLAERGGDGDPAEARAAVARATTALDEAVAAAAKLAALTTEAETLEADVGRARTALLSASQQVASLTVGNAAHAREQVTLAADLAAARAGFATLAKRSAAIAAAQRVTGDLLAALRHRAGTDTARQAAGDALAEALADSEFADDAEVRAALLSKPAAAALQEKIDAHAKAGTLNAAQLALPEVVAAGLEAESGIAAPTGTALEALREEARRRADESQAAAVRLGLAGKAAEQVAATRTAFHAHESRVAPLRERARLLGGLADAVRGGGDNLLKMTLTSYVLAARLEQVAVAASLRLSTMSDGRYTLSHTDARAGGNRKSGLGLEVVDGWTQQSRDTATLSGGESFMASLSLALGLADVVQHESGGLDIETLFVDEGFGSLDEESLEQVMDALEGLRDGGRMVGLVSHVAEMKSRIPVHLHVTKGRHGSTLALARDGDDAA